jgi:hypothetical protein
MQALILARLLGQQISMENINVCLSVVIIEKLKLRLIILYLITGYYVDTVLCTLGDIFTVIGLAMGVLLHC